MTCKTGHVSELGRLSVCKHQRLVQTYQHKLCLPSQQASAPLQAQTVHLETLSLLWEPETCLSISGTLSLAPGALAGTTAMMGHVHAAVLGAGHTN